METREPSIAEVIRNAIRDAQELVRSEIALAKAEVRSEVRRLGMGVALLAAAVFAAAVFVVLLMMTIAWAIADGFDWPVWAGYGISTLVMLLLAAILGYVGKARLTASRHMPQTVDTLKENIEWMRARTS